VTYVEYFLFYEKGGTTCTQMTSSDVRVVRWTKLFDVLRDGQMEVAADYYSLFDIIYRPVRAVAVLVCRGVLIGYAVAH
jgi:hypothetical protein